MSCLEDAQGRPALASAEQVVQGAPDVGRAAREEARESLLTLLQVDSNTTSGAAAWREQVDTSNLETHMLGPLQRAGRGHHFRRH